jgi:hypothetical protein
VFGFRLKRDMDSASLTLLGTFLRKSEEIFFFFFFWGGGDVKGFFF